MSYKDMLLKNVAPKQETQKLQKEETPKETPKEEEKNVYKNLSYVVHTYPMDYHKIDPDDRKIIIEKTGIDFKTYRNIFAYCILLENEHTSENELKKLYNPNKFGQLQIPIRGQKYDLLHIDQPTFLGTFYYLAKRSDKNEYLIIATALELMGYEVDGYDS